MKKILKIIIIVLLTLLGIFLLGMIPALSVKTFNMKAYQSNGFTIYSETENHADFDEITRLITASRDEIAKALGDADTGNIEIIIYPSNFTLHICRYGFFIGMFLPEWYIGDNTLNYVLITSPSNPGGKHDRSSILKASVHEYVHVLTDRINNNTDKWIKEGLATYLAGQGVRGGINKGIMFEDFDSGDPLRFSDVSGYALSHILISYIKENYGWDNVILLIQKGNTYENTLGKSKKDFFIEWKKYLQTL